LSSFIVCNTPRRACKQLHQHRPGDDFQDGGSRYLGFAKLKFLTIGTVKRFEMHYCAKLRQNQLNRGRDMAIFQFFKMAAATILDF